MDNTLSIENHGTVAAPALKGAAIGLAALLLVVGFTLLGLRQLRPPAAVPESAALTDFSSARAMRYLKAVAQRPHPVGSAEHAAVRDAVVNSLTEVGLAPEVQKASVVSQRRGAPFSAGTTTRSSTRSTRS